MQNYDCFSVDLFENGESLSKVSREVVVLKRGVDEDGIPFADTEDVYFRISLTLMYCRLTIYRDFSMSLFGHFILQLTLQFSTIKIC